MTKDKYKYVEGLLRNYKKNKSRIKHVSSYKHTSRRLSIKIR